ncbi:MAG TPA: M28 family peptidase [Gemmatimonadaceae bacterium]|nr:M28 family peptidase [Gemmatimonadaceae bacterium]
MKHQMVFLLRVAALVAAVPTLLAAQADAHASGQLPLKHKPQPTSADISAGDLMTRLYIFADDSMMGRETGTRGHLMSTAYIANELRRLGLEPAGDSGTFFQNVPMIRRAFDEKSTITVGDVTLHGGTDFIATAPTGAPPTVGALDVVFGGRAGDTTGVLTPDQTRGKLLLQYPAQRGAGRGLGFGGRGGRGGGAAIVGTIEEITPEALRLATHPREGQVTLKTPPPNSQPGFVSLTLTPAAAQTLLGIDPTTAAKGQAGKSTTMHLVFDEEPAPARNVIAIIRGSDAKLKTEFVALGAHNDHIGYLATSPQDHDSLHVFRQAQFAINGLVRRGQQPSVAQQGELSALHVNFDSLRRAHPVRLDSIRNGADDDGSGSVTLLEIAEAFAKASHKPKRSLLFVWHTGEEKGLLGSRWVTDHLPTPADSIVAQLNMDMIGRGDAQDIPGGSETYVQLVGSRRLSTELGDIVEQVNKTEKLPLTFDYQFDANGDTENIYCRSDHYNYARLGIPVVFFTTGLHGDYHQVTDEPQYIDYQHMARIGQLVHDIAVTVGNLDHRPLVDKPKPDPNGRCQQ